MNLIQLFVSQEREAITTLLGGGALVWLNVLLLGCLIALAPYVLSVAVRWRSSKNQVPTICLYGADALVGEGEIAFLGTELPDLQLGDAGDHCVIAKDKAHPFKIVARQARTQWQSFRHEADRHSGDDKVDFQFMGLINHAALESLKAKLPANGIHRSSSPNQIYLDQSAIRTTNTIWNSPDPAIKIPTRVAVWMFIIQTVVGLLFWWFPRS